MTTRPGIAFAGFEMLHAWDGVYYLCFNHHHIERMFHIDQVKSSTRLNSQGTKALLWAQLPRPEKDNDITDVYENMCR
ncbi:hypothetical protein HDU67_010061 [Dinochytrium kinnereticum]|nr:hypothetical protein HDU67_010061 [Dinochytrium kinnereticum]